jgi:alkylated DNA repair dioxygenase AlkB
MPELMTEVMPELMPEVMTEVMTEVMPEVIPEFDLENKQIIKDSNKQLYIEIFENCIEERFAEILFSTLITNSKWRDKMNSNGKKRNKCIYGSISTYCAVYQGKPSYTKVHNWDNTPLHILASQLSSITGDNYNTCVLQYYPNEKVGIKPHRDKEVGSNKCIVSLSLGFTRIMRFERAGVVYDIPLPNRSLCIIYPPTNEKWCHSIVCEDIPKGPRISLVFRNH